MPFTFKAAEEPAAEDSQRMILLPQPGEEETVPAETLGRLDASGEGEVDPDELEDELEQAREEGDFTRLGGNDDDGVGPSIKSVNEPLAPCFTVTTSPVSINEPGDTAMEPAQVRMPRERLPIERDEFEPTHRTRQENADGDRCRDHGVRRHAGD